MFLKKALSPTKPLSPPSPQTKPLVPEEFTDSLPVIESRKAAAPVSSPRPRSLLGASTRTNSKRDIFEVNLTSISKHASLQPELSKKWRREVSRDFSISSNDDHTYKIKEVLADRIARALVLKKAMHSVAPQFSTKIRFCIAVDDLEKAMDKEKKSKARKIVSLFVDPGAQFLIADLPNTVKQALLAGKYDQLETLQLLFIGEMFACAELKELFEQAFEEL